MDPEIKNKLLEIITSAQSVGADVYETVKQQAPLLADEVIKWKVVDLTVDFSIGFLFVSVAIILTYMAKRNWKKWNEGSSPVGVFAIGGVILATLIGFMLISSSITPLLQAKYAPRVFFLKTCKELVRGY